VRLEKVSLVKEFEPMLTVREAIYRTLRSMDIKIVFANPGSAELEFVKTMPSDFKSVLGLHDRTVGGMAVGYAIATGNAGFVVFDSVTSAGSGLSAIIDAHYCHVLLLITAGDQNLVRRPVEPFANRRMAEVFKPYIKSAYEPRNAVDVPAAIVEAFQLAMQPPKGPVLVILPVSDWNRPCEPPPIPNASPSRAPDPAGLEAVVQALESSSKSAMVVGSQIEEDGAWHQVVALAERLNTDVYEEPKASRWTFPRRHCLFRGSLLPAQKPLSDQLVAYDTILVIGAPVFLYYAYVPGVTVKPGTRVFQLTNSPMDASSALAGTSVVGNIAAAVEYICDRVKPIRDERRLRWSEPPESTREYPMTADYVFSVLSKIMPSNPIIAEEVPSMVGDLYRHVFLDEPGSFYSVRSGILGFAMPLAVGLQLARPDRRVVCPVGDGSAQYSIQALWSAAQYNAPVVFLLFRNGDYSALRGFRDFTKLGPNVPGLELPGIDAVLIAQAFGLAAREVDRPEDLAPALGEAFTSRDPWLISVNVQRGGETCMGMDLSVNPPSYA
jgi:benzoylformate decarboxylase